MIREYFLKWRFRKAFKDFLSPQASDKIANELLNGSVPNKPDLKAATIEFVCVSVQGDTPEITAERMTITSDIAVQNGGVIFSQISGIVIIAYGILVSGPDDTEKRGKLCESLRATLAGNVKIVHGKAHGHFGNLGSPRRVAFSFILPSFLKVLSNLAALPYGEIREFKDE